MVVLSGGGGLVEAALLAFRDVLNRRMSEALRAGRGLSVVKDDAAAAWAAAAAASSWVEELVVELGMMPSPPPPGAGKSLSAGS